MHPNIEGDEENNQTFPGADGHPIGPYDWVYAIIPDLLVSQRVQEDDYFHACPDHPLFQTMNLSRTDIRKLDRRVPSRHLCHSGAETVKGVPAV